jgi:hypothetical protein
LNLIFLITVKDQFTPPPILYENKKNAPKEADINFDIEGNLVNSLCEKCEIKKKNPPII